MQRGARDMTAALQQVMQQVITREIGRRIAAVGLHMARAARHANTVMLYAMNGAETWLAVSYSYQPDCCIMILSGPAVEQAPVTLLAVQQYENRVTRHAMRVSAPADLDSREGLQIAFHHLRYDGCGDVAGLLAVIGQLLEPAEGRDGECVIPLVNGNTIRADSYGANEAGSSYVRICGPDGGEVAYPSCDEWQQDPQLVMGAILGAANTPAGGGPARTGKDRPWLSVPRRT
jgi:hypothetical protein